MEHIFYYPDWNVAYGWSLWARITHRDNWGYNTRLIRNYGPNYWELRAEIERLTKND